MTLVFAWHSAAWSGALERLGLPEDAADPIANDLARCSGFWSAYADVETNAATTIEIDRVAREAKTAAAYLRLQVNADVRKSFEWAKSIAALEFDSWDAVMPITPRGEIEGTLQVCQNLIWMQKSIVDIMLDYVREGE